MVLPYFNVNKDAKSAISSDTFNSKAKAALTYYATEINSKLNEIYYIGCTGAGQPYANHEGGEAQKNYADNQNEKCGHTFSLLNNFLKKFTRLFPALFVTINSFSRPTAAVLRAAQPQSPSLKLL